MKLLQKILLAFTLVAWVSVTGLVLANNNQETSRGMYIWSSALKDYGAQWITDYLVDHNITTAFISYSNSTKDVFKKLLVDLPKNNIDVEVLVGDNWFLTNTNPTAYLDKLLKGIEIDRLSGIHIDVEPYSSSFPDFDANKEYYMWLYIKLLKNVRKYANKKGLNVAVDIPVSYSENILKEVYKYADKVYIMAYNITSMNYLAGKVADEVNQGKDKTVISLRANDFTNRQDFETYVSNASAKLNISTFALHDFRRFKQLPTSTP